MRHDIQGPIHLNYSSTIHSQVLNTVLNSQCISLVISFKEEKKKKIKIKAQST